MELYHLWDLCVIMHALNHLHRKAQMKRDTGIIVKVSLTSFGHFSTSNDVVGIQHI